MAVELDEFRAGDITCFVVSPPGPAPRRAPRCSHRTAARRRSGTSCRARGLLLAHAGYRVLLPNIPAPPAAAGRSSAPSAATGAGSTPTTATPCVDHAVAAGLADPERLGVFGLSYGGFLANWLVGTSDRFAAAVSENGVVNNVSAVGRLRLRADLLGVGRHRRRDHGRRASRRLAAVAAAARRGHAHTPLLILQGEADHRCPPGDAEQLFVALRALGREVEYVLYPESAHEFSSTGRPDRRIDRQTRVLDWFARWMPA